LPLVFAKGTLLGFHTSHKGTGAVKRVRRSGTFFTTYFFSTKKKSWEHITVKKRAWSIGPRDAHPHLS